MRTLLALIATVVACVLARPLAPTQNSIPQLRPRSKEENHGPQKYLSDYVLPRLIMSRFEGYEQNLRPVKPESEMENIDVVLNIVDGVQLQEPDSAPYYYGYVPGWMPGSRSEYMKNILADSTKTKYTTPVPYMDDFNPVYTRIIPETEKEAVDLNSNNFALSPLNEDYYKYQTPISSSNSNDVDGREDVMEQRQTRQNPNWSKQKALVAENLDRLRTGLANKDYRLPVSLLPNNLRWLKINHDNDLEESTQEDVEGTDKPKHIHVLETPTADPTESIYGVALIAAVGAALTMAIIGFVFGWYTLSKKAKAAADVDYPAYGVTGPTLDASGDRKLAQSAHMYHYQHQKQQIIAMERNLEHRNGSVSDPESEEENEEGDYTVYECPGFATTGDMEVKNPLFNEETPASIANADAKSQPRE